MSFLTPIEFDQDHLCNHGFGTIRCSLVVSPMGIQLKRKIPLPYRPSTYNSSVGRGRPHDPLLIHNWLLISPVLQKPIAGINKSCEVKVVLALIRKHFISLIFSSCVLSTPYSAAIFRMVVSMSYLGLITQPSLTLSILSSHDPQHSSLFIAAKSFSD